MNINKISVFGAGIWGSVIAQHLAKGGYKVSLWEYNEQLLNVLKGDMSFIGPRPLLPEYLPLYSPEQARRHEVRPGITGWAQVNGRNFLPFSKRFELDVWYVDNLNCLIDLKIILLSIKNVFLKKDVANVSVEKTNSDDLGFVKYINKKK